MRKPKAFLLNICLLGISGLLLAIGTFAFLVSEILGATLLAFAFLVGTAAVALFFTRQEKQNQRSNTTALTQRQSLLALQSEQRENADALVRSSQSMVKTAKMLRTQEIRTGNSSNHTKEASFGAEIIGEPEIREKKSEVLNGENVLQTFSVALSGDYRSYEFLPLSSHMEPIDIPVSNATVAEIRFTLGDDRSNDDPKAAIFSVSAFDKDGNEIDHGFLSSRSDKVGYFAYLPTRNEKLTTSTTLSIPKNATTLRLIPRRWNSHPEILNQVEIRVTEQNPEWLRNRRANQVKVAAVLDEFSFNCFKYECDMISVERSTWKKQLDDFQPDLFLCESAWSGSDSELRPWKGHVYASCNFNYQNRTEILGILDYCKERGIPTVFWNKEDPSHFDDKEHNFVDTAVRFDYVFTTDKPTVERYKKEYGVENVDVLPFAVQPRLFNPIESGHRSNDVVFAGSWYSNHVDRCDDMLDIFQAISDSGKQLKIYDRFYGSGDPSHEFPPQYQNVVNKPVPNDQVAKVYKESHFGLTINTETKSPTMFARRIFELMACNTFVISNYSYGVDEYFGQNVAFVGKGRNDLLDLSDEIIRRSKAENLQNVLTHHTYEKRFKQILDAVGLPYKAKTDDLAIGFVVDKQKDLQKAFNELRRISNWNGPKVLLCGASISDLEFSDALTDFNRSGIRVVQLEALRSGRASINQVLGGFVQVLVVPFGAWMGDSQEFRQNLEHMKTHSQYIEVPVVRGTQNASNNPSSTYEFKEVSFDEPMLVGSDSLIDVANTIVSDKSIIAYVV